MVGALLWFCRTERLSAAPVIVPDQAVVALDEFGLYQPGYQLRGAPETLLPVGWTSGLDSPTGAACQAADKQGGEEAWLLHCPWRGRTGVTFQDFTFKLPPVPRITLLGDTALRADAVGKSDGVTFRVFVNGEKRYDTHRDDGAWLPFAVDLTSHAGEVVTLRFETDPGPHDNASFDFALWGNRRLELPGLAVTTAARPEPPPLDLRTLVSRPNGSLVPLSGFPGKTAVRVDAGEAVLSYAGEDGNLAYHWNPKEGESLFGSLALQAAMRQDTSVSVPLASGAGLDWTSSAQRADTRLFASNSAGGQPQATLVRTYRVGGQTATVTVLAWLEGKSLVLDVTGDLPLVRALDGGGWGPVLRRRTVRLPYCALRIQYLESENLFVGDFLDWTNSHASSQTQTRAVYDPLTDGTRRLLHERWVYTAAWHLDETLPNLSNPPSPFRAYLSHRVMLDIWGGGFADVQARLHALAEGGFGPGLAILHDWQFGGYDNKLPQHVPANANLGGDPTLAALVAEGVRDDLPVALHENYVDDYPNAPDFAEGDLARLPDGSRVPAWFNPSTKVQSFAVKPTRILPLAQTQGPEILRRYGTRASYLDVHSAVPPWFHVDAQADQPGSGQFAAVWDAHRALWAYERDLHAGPVFGEGNNHWYWSGLLDGVEAQFGQGWLDGKGTTAPLLVDFDLLKIHPLQLNHGMGYYERWWPRGPDSQRALLSLLDQYRMQEVAYGHQGFLGGEAWHDPGYAWLESHLLPPLIARTALANPVAIDYWTNSHWLDATAAAKAGTDWSQVRVRYDHGPTVYANGCPDQTLSLDEASLPPFGWFAQGAGLTAGTTLRRGVVTDYAETPDTVFANARPRIDWEEREITHLLSSVTHFAPTGPRTFRASYEWQVGQAVAKDLRCFVHFVSAEADPAGENIRFQQDHPLALPPAQWKLGQTVIDGPWDITVPAGVAPGDYTWTLGLYEVGEERLILQGASDTRRRRLLGTLHLAADGAVSFTPRPLPLTEAAPLSPYAPLVDFGDLRTDGSVYLSRDGGDWTLRPFPADRPFTVQLSAARFNHPPSVDPKDGWWQLPLTGEHLYRWPASK